MGTFFCDASKPQHPPPDSDAKLSASNQPDPDKPVKQSLTLLLMLMLMLASFHLDADVGRDGCDVDGMLRDLQSQVTGPLSAQQLTSARQILGDYCSAEVADAVAVTEETVRAELTEEEEPPPTLFGIEFRKADEDSKGHDRLRKRP